jgi:hypothetical protein
MNTESGSYTRDELVKQPIGYWSGEAYRRIARALRESLARNGLSQPQWWVLNRLDDPSRVWTRSGLVDELKPFSDNEQGLDVSVEIDRLIDNGLASAEADVVTMTGEGAARLGAARERNGRTHQDMRSGIDDEEYAVTIDVLRRIVGNLGGDSRLP